MAMAYCVPAAKQLYIVYTWVDLAKPLLPVYCRICGGFLTTVHELVDWANRAYVLIYDHFSENHPECLRVARQRQEVIKQGLCPLCRTRQVRAGSRQILLDHFIQHHRDLVQAIRSRFLEAYRTRRENKLFSVVTVDQKFYMVCKICGKPIIPRQSSYLREAELHILQDHFPDLEKVVELVLQRGEETMKSSVEESGGERKISHKNAVVEERC